MAGGFLVDLGAKWPQDWLFCVGNAFTARPGAASRITDGRHCMDERRILTEQEAFRLLAHYISTAELHTIEPPHYAGRRMVEGTIPLLEAMMRDGDDESRQWLEHFKHDLQAAMAARRRDEAAYERWLHEAPGRITQEIKRRGLLASEPCASDEVGA